MTNEDRELLEAAAKAAGIKLLPQRHPVEAVKRLARSYAIHYAEYRSEAGFEGRDDNLRKLAELEDAIDSLAAQPAPVAIPNDAEGECGRFYAAYLECEEKTGHKPTAFDVWLLAKGLMTTDGKGSAPVAAAGSPEPVARMDPKAAMQLAKDGEAHTILRCYGFGDDWIPIFTQAPASAEARDAARYRWLRAGKARTTGAPKAGRIEICRWEDRSEGSILKGDALDAAIDAAIDAAVKTSRSLT